MLPTNRITKPLVLGFIAVAFLVIVMGVMSVREINSLASNTVQMYEHPLTVSNAVLQANTAIVSMHRYMKDVVLARDGKDLEMAIALVDEKEKEVLGYFEIVLDKFLGDKTRIVNVRNAFVEWKTIRSEVIELTRLGQYSDAAAITKGKGADYVAELTVEMDGLIKFASNKAKDFLSQSRSAHSKSVINVWFLLAALLTIATVICFLVYRRMSLDGARLWKSEEQLRSVLSNTPSVIFIKDLEGKYLLVNSMYEQLFNIMNDEIRGKTDFDLFSPYVADKFAQHDLEVIESVSPIEVEEVVPHETEDHIYLSVKFPLLDVNGSPYAVCGIASDITERKLSEQNLRESEERFRSLVHSSTTIIWTTDANGAFVTPQDSWAKFTGQAWADHRGYGWSMKLHPDDRDRVKTEWGQALENKERYETEGKIWCADSEKYHDFLVEAVPLFSNDGTVREWIGTILDTTERKEMERTLRQSHKMEAVGNLAGGIAHDVNNMLLPIISLSRMTMKDLPEGSKGRTRLEKVVEAGEKAKNIVSGMLAFSRADQEKAHNEEENIADVVQNSIDLLKTALPSTINVKENIDPNTGTVLCDHSQISTILMNLGSNATHAMGGHVGDLEISVSPVEVNQALFMKISGLKLGKFAKIAVTDTGCGMDTETLTKIFDPFFTTKEVGEGTGLGLSMSHGIIANHGGAIDVASEIGVGTTFDIYLPLVDNGV
jgi:PAS domain S-box-containing protein